MNIVFMGTPDFAADALKAIIDAGHNVVLAVTQPDRKQGRGKEVKMSPVKECAINAGIPVFQPLKVRESESVEFLKGYKADIFVVAAFGQILSKEVLDMPKFGCVNIHASLLPKLRGAAPIQQSILDGDSETGITIMQMDEGLDTGAMLMQKSIAIEDTDTGASLFNKLSKLGAEAIVEALPKIEAGALTPIPQDNSKSTYAGMLKKDMGRLDWEKDAKTLGRYVRGLNPWPGAYTYYNGKNVKIWEAESFLSASEAMEKLALNDVGATGLFKEFKTGEVAFKNKHNLLIACKEGFLNIKSIQMEGKKRMSISDFLLGMQIAVGDIFDGK